MAIHSNTRQELRHILSDLWFDDLVTGTVASAASGNFVCTATDWERGDGYFDDFMEVFDYSGTGVGTSGNPTDWVNTTHTLTFLPAATLTNGDSVELHRRFTVTRYDRAINAAINAVAREALVNKVEEVTVLDSLLTNGFFTGAITSGWTTDGNSTSSIDTTYYKTGARSGKLVTDGTNLGYLRQQVANYPELEEVTLMAKAWCWTTTADRVRLSLADGVATSYSSYHDGEGWQELEITSHTVDDAATELTLDLSTSAGAAVTCYWDCAWLAGEHIYEYDLDTEFLYIHRVEMETSTNDRDVFQDIDYTNWRLLPESTQRIQFVNWTPTAGRRIRISGLASPATLSADTTECPINPDFLCWQAATYLHNSRIRGNDVDSEDHRRQMLQCQAMADRLRPSLRTRLPQGSRAVIEL